MSKAAGWQDYVEGGSNEGWQDYSARPKTITPPPQPPGMVKRFAQAVGLPTSMDELKSAGSQAVQSMLHPRDTRETMPGGKEGPGGAATDTLAAPVSGYARNLATEATKAGKEAADAGRNIAEGGPVVANVGKGASAATDLTLRGVLAPVGGPGVANFGEDIAGKNWSGAGGSALGTLVNALLLRGKQTPSTAQKVNKLGFATGGAETGIEAALPELEKTTAGKPPKTIGEFESAVKDTGARLEQKFNGAIARTRGQTIVPDQIARDLMAKADTLPPTTEGQAIAGQLKNAATEYQRPWSLADLNKERIYRNGLTNALHKKSASGASAAMRSNVDTMIDETVAESTRDVLYGELDRRFPGENFRSDKLTQSHLWDVRDQLDSQIESLKHAQAVRKGAPPLSQPSASLSAHPGGVTPRVHLGRFLTRGPMESANSAVASAFAKPGVGTAAGRAAVLALPLAHLREITPPPPTQPDAEAPDQQ